MRKELELAATRDVLEDLGRACRLHCRTAEVAACATGRILEVVRITKARREEMSDNSLSK